MYGVMKQEILSNLTDVSVFIKKPRQFEWEPKEDITPYELALCVGVLILAMHGMSGEAYDQLPESAKRHFIEV
jgi:hypothetical protein